MLVVGLHRRLGIYPILFSQIYASYGSVSYCMRTVTYICHTTYGVIMSYELSFDTTSFLDVDFKTVT